MVAGLSVAIRWDMHSRSGACLKAALAIGIGLALIARPALAGESRIAAAGCTVEIDGDSTLHKYSATSHDCRCSFGVSASVAGSPEPQTLEALMRGHLVDAFSMAIPVGSLKSGDKHLDQHMWKALKQSQFPRIRFEMTSYRVTAAAAPGATFTLEMQGHLEVAGVSRPIQLTASARPTANGLQVWGAKDLLMTDYDVTPPTLMFGAIKTADAITIKFNVELR